MQARNSATMSSRDRRPRKLCSTERSQSRLNASHQRIQVACPTRGWVLIIAWGCPVIVEIDGAALLASSL